MAQPVMQFSFNSGEWAPALNARVDVAKYHSGAALLRNFFVDYRGGATARPGTRYIMATKFTSTTRLIPFQASFTVTYVLEFGEGYIRFISNGAQVETSPGVPYEIASPYTAAELAQIKYAQSVNIMILCHPNHPPYQLTLISATNWTLAAITFGSTVSTPAAPTVTTTLAAGTVNYAYIVTAVDPSGQESAPSPFGTLALAQDIRSVAGTNTVTWAAVTDATSYNVYRAEPSYAGSVPAGSPFGFIGNVTGLSIIDSNIGPDFSIGPPVVQNPFVGSGVLTITLTAGGSYGPGVTFPTITFTGGGGGTGAAAVATGHVVSTNVSTYSTVWSYPGDIHRFNYGVVLQVATIDTLGGLNPPWGVVLTYNIINAGTIGSGTSTPTAQAPTSWTTLSGQSPNNGAFGVDFTWEAISVALTASGGGYTVDPTVVFSSGAAAATATIGAPSGGGGVGTGNSTVPGFFQQRLVLAGPVGNPQFFSMSQPGSYYNFNISSPVEPDNAISGTLVSGQLNTIQSMIVQPQGLIMLSDKQAWLLNGGAAGAPVSATQIVANAHAYNGANVLPPIVANDNILYVQSKSSIVRDLVYNYYTAVYTGTDVSVLSSHLFYGYTISEWAWAEEPFKVVWAIRNDGTLLSLTFLKEQELVAWAHSDTQGQFKSIASVTETVAVGSVDAVYMVVQRTISGVLSQYIERLTELYYPTGLTDAWCVDSGLQYNGSPTLTFSGAGHLINTTVTGLATDNNGNVTVINPTVNGAGAFTLPAPPSPATGYTRVTVGLGYTPQLQTLQLDTGQPTIQGKMKSIPAVTVRCHQTLGLSIGKSFHTLVPMKDLVRGNVGSATNAVVTDLVTGDAMTRLDPSWTVPGQYCIQQDYPFPSSILGVIPQVAVGDTPK